MNPLAQPRSFESPPTSEGRREASGKIGRFELLEELGQGSMGIVYLARDPMIGRWVAVKKLTGIKGKLLDPEVVRRLLINEARNVGALEHPGIVMVFDLIEDRDGKVEALAMEYVAGKSLRQRLNEPHPFSLRYVSEIISSVAEVLDYAHANGCIHRDVKPANVLLSDDGAIKVADFGIAALRGEDLASELRNLGTPNYLAPERVLGQPGDQHTDIYSLGVILYELLTRHLPFEASTIAELVQRIIEEEPTPPNRYVPEMMPGLLRILEKALAKEPQDRYELAGALASDLREVVEAQASLNDTVPAPAIPRRTRRPELSEARSAPRPIEVPRPELLAPLDSDLEQAVESLVEVVEVVEVVEDLEVVEWETESAEPEAPRLPRMKPAMVVARGKELLAGFALMAGSGARIVVTAVGAWVGPALRTLRERPAVAAALAFGVALPILLVILASGAQGVPSAEPPPSGSMATAELGPRVRYLGLLLESRRLHEAGERDAAAVSLTQAEALFPETREEVRQEALLELAVEVEMSRLARVDQVVEQAHLQIARTDFADAEQSMRELTELGASAEVLELLESSLDQSKRRLLRVRRDEAPQQEADLATGAVVPQPAAPPAVARRLPPKTGPGTLRIEFSSARPRGVLAVYSGGRQILNRPYRFVDRKNFFVRKGVSGSFRENIELTEGIRELKIYLSQPKVSTQLRPVRVTIPPGDIRILRLRVQADGELVLGSR